ncbi:MAG: hypothetical protein ACAI35_21090 [Candidatus Methylacidiphilales bacterium]|nr:hypothetical protein [Candidatus Methylacidiphilales bacterium]
MPGSSPSDSEHDKDKDTDADAADESEALTDAEAAGHGVVVSPALVGLAFPFRFIFTAEEFGRASAYHFAWQFRYMFWPARIVGLVLIVGVAIGWSSRPPALNLWTGLLHLFSGAIMLTYVQLLVWTSLRSFRKSRLHGLQMSIIMRGDGLHIRSAPPGTTPAATAGTGEDAGSATPTRHVEWERFTSAVIVPGGVVLYQTTGNFHWLPYTGMLPPARSVSAPAESGNSSEDTLTSSANPTQLLEDFLRLHVPKVSKM